VLELSPRQAGRPVSRDLSVIQAGVSCVPFGLMSQAPVRPMLASTIEMPLTVFVTDREAEQERT